MPDERTPIPPADMATALQGHPRAFLFTLRADGSPTVHPMTTQVCDGRVGFSTYGKSQKTRNVERDARAAVLLLKGYQPWPGAALVLYGRARISAGQTRPGARAGRPSGLGSVPDAMSEVVQARVASGKRIWLGVEGAQAERLAPSMGAE